MSAIDAVLFDLDGTLLDTAPDMAHALNILLDEHHRDPLPFPTVRPLVSTGSIGLIELGFGCREGELFDQLRARFLELYREHIARESDFFPGIPEVINELIRRDITWGIVTNKPGWLTTALFDELDHNITAACVVSGDTVSPPKPHPAPLLHAANLIDVAPERCCYVGDHERDVIAGKGAGMKTLAARYGYIEPGSEITLWQADGIIDQPQDVLSWLG